MGGKNQADWCHEMLGFVVPVKAGEAEAGLFQRGLTIDVYYLNVYLLTS